VTPGKDFSARGWGIRLSDVTLRFQGSRTRIPACMTSPRENTPHMLYSGHTMSTDRVAECATRIYVLPYSGYGMSFKTINV